MSLLSLHALLLFIWLIGGSGESFGSFLAIFWSIVTGVFILFKWIGKKASFSELSIEDSDDGKGKVIYKLNNLHWTPTGSMQTSIRKYVAFRMHAHNIEDFDWLVKYITAFGYYPNGDIDNPYAEKRIMLNGSDYICRSVNPDYTVTEIYRIPYSDEEKDLVERIRFSKIEPKAKSLTEAMYMKIKTNPCEPTFENALDSIKQLKEENPQFFGLARKSSTLNNVEIVEDIEELEEISLPPMVKLSLSKTKYLVEERFKKDPVVQYNLQLLKEKEAELKEKKEEYRLIGNSPWEIC